MNRQIAFAIILACIATALAYFYLGSKEAAMRAEVTPWQVLVARSTIHRGSRLCADLVTMQEIPAAYVEPGALASASSQVLERQWRKYQNQSALVTIAKGEQILPNKFSASAPGFAAAVPEKLRSVAFTLESAAAVGGNLRPGNRVDVLATGPLAAAQGKKLSITTLVQNVQVLAVGLVNALDQGQDRLEVPSPAAGLDVCLALSPQDALRLSLAEKTGSLKLALRGPEDDSEIDVGERQP